jgi:biopolymer transport protein ExbD
MTPMVDVTFQLIIFFMLSSSFVVQSSLPIEVPESPGATQLEQKDCVVTLTNEPGGPDNQGRVLLMTEEEREIGSWEELQAALSALQRERPDALVLVRADARVPTGRTVKAFGYIVAAGIQRYGIAARAPAADEEEGR